MVLVLDFLLLLLLLKVYVCLFVFLGKLVLVYVTGFARRKPKAEQLENANPIRIDHSNLWECPFCHQNDFPELSDVSFNF